MILTDLEQYHYRPTVYTSFYPVGQKTGTGVSECVGFKVPSFTASEVTTLWRDRNVCIITIIIIIT